MPTASVEVGRRIAGLLQQPVEEQCLDLLVLTVAEIAYDEVPMEKYRAQLDELASTVKMRPEESSLPYPEGIVNAMNRCLFEQHGFHGNATDYYDARNSFLNEVLDRRTGIPILLCTIYMEIGRRLGVKIQGVGLPGHFVVRIPGSPDLLVDPFHGGCVLTELDCENRLREIYGPEMRMEPVFLEPVSNKYILTRILNNLRSIYLNNRAFRKAIDVLDVLLEIYPLSAEDYRQRALLHRGFKNYARAIADFEAYLRSAADPSDADEIKQHIIALKRLLASMN